MLPSASSSSPTRKATIRRASGVPPSFLDRVVPVRQFHPAMKRAFAIVLGACCASAAAAPKAPLLVGPSPAWVTISTEELRGAFDTLWAVSDVHGRLRELDQLLLAANLVSRDAANQLVWNPSQRRQLLVVVGDYIDGGPESVGVVLRVRRLIPEAAAAGSRIVTLLGNHEAAFLADPRSANRRLLSSARRASAELALPSRLTPEQLADSEFGTFLRSMPIAAFIGSWLFAHSGDLDARRQRTISSARRPAIDHLLSRLVEASGPPRGDEGSSGKARPERARVRSRPRCARRSQSDCYEPGRMAHQARHGPEDPGVIRDAAEVRRRPAPARCRTCHELRGEAELPGHDPPGDASRLVEMRAPGLRTLAIGPRSRTPGPERCRRGRSPVRCMAGSCRRGLLS